MAHSPTLCGVDVLPEGWDTWVICLPKRTKRGWNSCKARFYTLTRSGRKQLVKETTKWHRLRTAIGRVLGPEAREG